MALLRYREWLAAFSKCQSGAVAIIFGLALLPLVLMAAGAIEFSEASRNKSGLAQAADSALLAALRVAHEQLRDGKPNWKVSAEKHAANVFAQNVRKTGLENVPSAATITLTNGSLTGEITYGAKSPTRLLKLAGLTSIPLSGSASATIGAAQFTDIHFVVDISASMGIGATTADQQKMQASVGCAVACHHAEDGNLSSDNLAAVRATGATLRLDVVRKAIMEALTKLPNNGSTRVAIHTFSNSLKTVFPLSSNITSAITAARALEISGENRQGGTNFHYSLNQLNTLLTTAGNGLTAGQPRGYVMLATDAVEDSNSLHYANGAAPPFAREWIEANFVVGKVSYLAWGLHYVQAPDPANCAPIKAKGYTMMTLETKYLIPEGVENPTFDAVRGDMGPAMSKSLTECASSPGYYFHAESPTEIEQAIAAMVGATVSLRLTQ